MDLINELLKFTNKDNIWIIDNISNTIMEYKIKNYNELSNLQDNLFVINGKNLNLEEKIDYSIKTINSNIYYLDELNYEESIKIINLKKELENNISVKDKITNIIKVYSLMKFDILFVKEAYDLVVNGNL